MNESDKQLIKEAVYEVIEPFIARIAQDYETIQQWMKRIEQRLDSLEQRVGSLEQRVGSLEQRVGGLEHQVASLERRVSRLEIELHEVKQRLESLEQRLAERGFVESEELARERWATFADLRRLELRVTQLEAVVFQGQRPAEING